MSKHLVPDADSIAHALEAAGKPEARRDFEDALARGDKIAALRIARQAGVIGADDR